MKILILNFEHPPLGGGGGRVSRDLAEEWASQGHHVDIITSQFRKLPKFECQSGFSVYRVPILGRKDLYASTFLSMFSYLFTGFLQGLKLCKKNKYNVINTHFAIPTGPLGILLSKIFRIKNILELHGGDIYNPNYKVKPQENYFLRKIIRLILNSSSQIIVHSKDLKEKTEKYYHPNKIIQMIPIGFKKPNFEKISRSELLLNNKKFYLISVSRLVLRKRIDRIIKALSRLNNSNVELLILGDGPEKVNLENLAFKLKIKNSIHFLGFVSEEKKFQYLSCSDAFISTSEHEGFGINFQEAIYCNLPIISTDCKGIIDQSLRFYNFNNLKQAILTIQNEKQRFYRHKISLIQDTSKEYLKYSNVKA